MMFKVNKKIKVLHLIKTSDGATWALRLCRELIKLGVEIHVIIPAVRILKNILKLEQLSTK